MLRPLLSSTVAFLMAIHLLGQPSYAQDHEPADPYWTMAHLDLDVTVRPTAADDEGSPGLTTRGRLRVRLNGGPTNQLVLRFNRNQQLAQVSVEEHSNTEVDIGAGQCEITLPETLQPGASITVEFRCELAAEDSFLQVQPDVAFAVSGTYWYPTPVPAPGVARTKSLSAAGTTALHLPREWIGWTQGKLLSRDEDESGVHEKWDVPLSVSRTLAAGPFQEHREDKGERTAVVLAQSNTENVAAQAQTMLETIPMLERHFGTHSFAELDYALIEVPDRCVNTFYAVADPSVLIVRSQAFSIAEGNLMAISHEFGHGWWGLDVGVAGPGYHFISEGLAQYCSVLAIEAFEPDQLPDFFENGRRPAGPRSHAKGYFQRLRDGRDQVISETMNGHPIATSKGIWIYHMLRRRIGDEVFFETLRSILEKHRHRALELPTFRSEFVAAAPEADLKQFFAQWLDQTGTPVLELDWTPGDREFVIRQEQHGDLYHLDVEVALVDAEGTIEALTVRLNEKRQRFSLRDGFSPTEIRLDPNKRLLIWRPEYGDRPSS